MLPPDFFDYAANDILDLYGELEKSILRDIVRRLTKTGTMTSTAVWQAQQLQESGLLMRDITAMVSRMSGTNDKQVEALFENAGVRALKYDIDIYEAAGLTPLPIRQSPAASLVLRAGITKTAGNLKNLSMTTAVATQQEYISATTLAEMQVESGAFDYVTAIRNAVRKASKSGSVVLYPSGHKDLLDVAIRRATLTGASQTASQLSTHYADDMGCDLVETTAHPGARPEHALWQGRVFSRSGHSKKYPDFVTNTRYGYGDGLCGWNCRHGFYPYFEGLSSSAYPKNKISEYNNSTVNYHGETMSYYDATQRQRAMERTIRSTKREIAGYDEGMKSADEKIRNAMKEDFSTASVKLKRQETALNDFINETGLDRQREREQILGFGRSAARKAVYANKNMQFIKTDAETKAASELPKKVNLPVEKMHETVEVSLANVHGIVPNGADATEVYTMAGKGTSTPIRNLKRLYSAYPQAGPASGWQKKSGTVYTQNHKYVIHWYENNGYVVESKLKGGK